MPDVLGAVEHPEGQAGQEVARRQVASDGPDGEAGARLEKLRDILQLGDVVLLVAAILSEQLKVFVELFASVLFVQLRQLLEDHRPTLGLLGGIVDARNWLAPPVLVGDLGELFAPLPIDGVLEALPSDIPEAEGLESGRGATFTR